MDDRIESALRALPSELTNQSGAIFYSGTAAFTGSRPLYVLGLNPGGDPGNLGNETIAKNIDRHSQLLVPWSAYKDESWQTGRAPGTFGIQPIVLHLFHQIGMDPRETPASNVVFVRTRNEQDLKANKANLLNQCWPFHKTVIDALGVRVVICLGTTAGNWTRERLGANRLECSFVESNNRGWKATAHAAEDGRLVVSLPHPAKADWRNPDADPSGLVQRALGKGP